MCDTVLNRRTARFRVVKLWIGDRENVGLSGNYHTYELDVPFESSLSALEEKIDVGEQFDDLRGLADANDVA